jgi:uncharacterized damage-inducible protein DinB
MEKTIEIMEGNAGVSTVITPQALLAHWQGHRRLTRRVIEAFPDDHLYTYSVGGMRPFSELVMEMIDIAGPGINGIVTGKWEKMGWTESNIHTQAPADKNELLVLWDQITDELDTWWPQIKPGRFQETDKAFGMYEGTIYDLILYFIDNEIHHRGQGYVYLRTLGIEPPAFYDRS